MKVHHCQGSEYIKPKQIPSDAPISLKNWCLLAKDSPKDALRIIEAQVSHQNTTRPGFLNDLPEPTEAEKVHRRERAAALVAAGQLRSAISVLNGTPDGRDAEEATQ